MNEREYIEPTIIKSERVDKLCELKSVDDDIRDIRFEGSVEWLEEAFDKMDGDLYDIAHNFVERCSAIMSLSQIASDIPLRTPDVIKKELKHAKNPMEIKRLNKELTDYYKDHKKRKNCKGENK